VQTSFTYDPFGNPTAAGASDANTQQYTGRETDGAGLQYNRARYYSPTLQRFISEDPLGFVGEAGAVAAGSVGVQVSNANKVKELGGPFATSDGTIGAYEVGGILGDEFHCGVTNMWEISFRDEMAKGMASMATQGMFHP
jgi:RHS repeat-associated protein